MIIIININHSNVYMLYVLGKCVDKKQKKFPSPWQNPLFVFVVETLKRPWCFHCHQKVLVASLSQWVEQGTSSLLTSYSRFLIFSCRALSYMSFRLGCGINRLESQDNWTYRMICLCVSVSLSLVLFITQLVVNPGN